MGTYTRYYLGSIMILNILSSLPVLGRLANEEMLSPETNLSSTISRKSDFGTNAEIFENTGATNTVSTNHDQQTTNNTKMLNNTGANNKEDEIQIIDINASIDIRIDGDTEPNENEPKGGKNKIKFTITDSDVNITSAPLKLDAPKANISNPEKKKIAINENLLNDVRNNTKFSITTDNSNANKTNPTKEDMESFELNLKKKWLPYIEEYTPTDRVDEVYFTITDRNDIIEIPKPKDNIDDLAHTPNFSSLSVKEEWIPTFYEIMRKVEDFGVHDKQPKVYKDKNKITTSTDIINISTTKKIDGNEKMKLKWQPYLETIMAKVKKGNNINKEPKLNVTKVIIKTTNDNTNTTIIKNETMKETWLINVKDFMANVDTKINEIAHMLKGDSIAKKVVKTLDMLNIFYGNDGNNTTTEKNTEANEKVEFTGANKTDLTDIDIPHSNITKANINKRAVRRVMPRFANNYNSMESLEQVAINEKDQSEAERFMFLEQHTKRPKKANKKKHRQEKNKRKATGINSSDLFTLDTEKPCTIKKTCKSKYPKNLFTLINTGTIDNLSARANLNKKTYIFNNVSVTSGLHLVSKIVNDNLSDAIGQMIITQLNNKENLRIFGKKSKKRLVKAIAKSVSESLIVIINTGIINGLSLSLPGPSYCTTMYKKDKYMEEIPETTELIENFAHINEVNNYNEDINNNSDELSTKNDKTSTSTNDFTTNSETVTTSDVISSTIEETTSTSESTSLTDELFTPLEVHYISTHRIMADLRDSEMANRDESTTNKIESTITEQTTQYEENVLEKKNVRDIKPDCTKSNENEINTFERKIKTKEILKFFNKYKDSLLDYYDYDEKPDIFNKMAKIEVKCPCDKHNIAKRDLVVNNLDIPFVGSMKYGSDGDNIKRVIDYLPNLLDKTKSQLPSRKSITEDGIADILNTKL